MEKSKGRDRKSWRERVQDDMDELGLHPEWAVFRDVWRGFISPLIRRFHFYNLAFFDFVHEYKCMYYSYRGKRLTLTECGRNRRFKNK